MDIGGGEAHIVVAAPSVTDSSHQLKFAPVDVSAGGSTEDDSGRKTGSDDDFDAEYEEKPNHALPELSPDNGVSSSLLSCRVEWILVPTPCCRRSDYDRWR